MVPFPIILHCNSELRELTEDLSRLGVSEQPYVDQEGKLVGVAANKHTVGETHNIYLDGGECVTLAMPETIRHDATFPEIYEAFSSRGCSTLVVTAEDRPLGYVTFDGFLSMIDPITTESFAHCDKSIDELASLIVPTTIGDSLAKVETAV
jgi:predicted transcriptional regulator